MITKPIIIRHFCLPLLLLLCNIAYATTFDQTIADRVVATSAQFLNKPYLFEPLGEGPAGKFNQEPLYRFDFFDCETYVDTVLALALLGNFQQNILQIRYGNGVPDFFMRNHFPETDWLPNNERKGLVKDITTQIAKPSQLVTQAITVDYQDWYKNLPPQRIKIDGLNEQGLNKKLSQLHAHANEAPPNQTINLTYIRLSALADVENEIPNGAIIMIVKPQQTAGSDMLISHMGFAIWENNELYLRAASSLYGRVVDLPLLSYLNRMPGIKGIKVLMPSN